MIHFDKERMAQVAESHERWWRGELDRPLHFIRITDAYEGERCDVPVLTQANCHDFSYTPEQIIDAWDAQLSRYEFLGDSYPHVNLDAFGPGIVAAFCGARLDNSSGAVWFFPEEEGKPIGEIHAHYDPDNIWARRIKEICRAGVSRWNGSVIMGFPDMGGNLDIAASLVGTEELLFAMLEEPEEVQRLLKEIQTAWYEAYEDIRRILEPQGGYSDWNCLLSKTPSYILQCDFSAMIGQDMYREFVLGCIREDTKRLGNTIYHLDGVDALRHLDDLLTLEDLNAVQWIQGAGQPGVPHWTEVYRKIHAAGKRMMLSGSPAEEIKRFITENPDYKTFDVLDFTKENEAAARLLLD